ncbi:MAG: ribosome silencing factor [Bacillota bacterium]
MDSLELAKRIVQLADDRRAKDPVILGLQSLSIVADYFVLLSGTSRTQVQSIARHIEDELSRLGLPAPQKEGDQDAKWFLLDYNDVIVHIFQDETRNFYNLERLWNDARRIDLDELPLS